MLALSIIATLMVLSAWAVVFFVPVIPWWIALLVTLFFACIILGILIFRFVRARLRAASLERELLRQATEQADKVRPDRRAEILALQAQMKEAIGQLKQTKMGRKAGARALYALPWYVIVGPPAAGKTTALEKSGLSFTAAAGKSPRMKGTAGTRNCDWWFSQDAILLDTAGRFAVEDDDQDEWFSFLDTVKKFRPKRPIDGVVVAVSVTDVMNADETQIEDLATKLRTRVDELMNRVEMVVPVYVMFTKADLIAGFVEFWSDFNKTQRGKVWGATFAREDDRLAEPARAFEDEFDRLVKVLHSRMLTRLNGERVPATRARVLQFPLEFQALRGPMAKFLEELCRANPFSDTPILRGFYFTSGTQVGRPIDKVLSNMARGFNLPQRNDPPVTQPQSYFVTELFKTIIFPDRHLAGRTNTSVRKYLKRRIVLAVAMIAFTLITLLLASVNYVSNLDLVHSTTQVVDEAVKVDPQTGASSGRSALVLLLNRVKLLDQEKASFHIPAMWGLTAANALRDPVQNVYVTRLRTVMDGPIKDELTGSVRAIGDMVRADAENYESAYKDLRLYVMLVTAPEHLEPEWAAEGLAETWAGMLRSDALTEELAAHARYYTDALATHPKWLWKTDDPVLARARAKLSAQPLEEIQYGWLISQAKGVPPFRPEKIFYGPSAQYFAARGGVVIPGPYTREGWAKVHAALDTTGIKLLIEPWVFGGKAIVATDAQRASNAERLKEIYFQRYGRAWNDFLGGVNVETPGNIRLAIDELRALSETDGPYLRLFRAISDNVTLDMGSTTLVGKATERGRDFFQSAAEKLTGFDAGVTEHVISPVERQFKPLLKFAFGDTSPGKAPDATPAAMSQYLGQLTTLEVALSQMKESRGEPTEDFDRELSRTSNVVQRLLGGFDPATRLVLEPLLMNPIRGSRGSAVSTGNNMLDDKWKAEVFELWRTKFSGRYPFADSADEVSLAELGDFFRPNTGALWRFYEKNLQDRLERSGKDFVAKASADPIPFRGDFLSCLTTSGELTDALFGTSPEMAVPFSVKLQPVGADIAEITLRIDGQAIVYRNEPERWIATQWPGKGAPKGGTLEAKGTAGFNDQIPRNGDFGLFRLLAAGNLRPLGQNSDAPIMVATWTLNRAGEAPVTIQLRPGKGTHPFGRDFFRRVKCPPIVVGGGVAGKAR